ncbi:MAG TPA: hypothetical protein VMV31_07865 [Terriglobales bacterium]|nr:hypothetical protein [Terriglobales bacterium]
MNPDCQRVRAQSLERFVAGHPADSALAAHLADCDACRAEFEAWQQAALTVRRWRVATSPALREQTRLRLRQQSEKLRQRRQAYWFLAAACAISAAVNAAAFRWIWAAAGLLQAWLGWPALSQPAMLAAWMATPLVVVVLVLWLVQSNPVDGVFTLEEFRHD